MKNAWKAEPALISGFVAAVLVLLVAFNIPITDAQQQAVLGLTAAALMLLQAGITRQNVYAPDTVKNVALDNRSSGYEAGTTNSGLPGLILDGPP